MTADRPGRVGGLRATGLPYLLILPAVLIVVAVAGWPLVKIVVLSLSKQESSKFALFHHRGSTPFVGLDNYTAVLTDSNFWTVVIRTVVFTAVNVVISLLLGMAFAILMNRVSNWARLLLTAVLLFVWAVPSTVSSQVFYWMFNNQFGVVNYLLGKLPGVHLQGHDWFADPVQGLAVVSVVVIWGALPLLAISLHAGLTQVPPDVLEAARVDGASSWQSFRNVTLPYLRPLLIIMTTLSIIWDFGVFNQIFFMRNGHPEPGYQTIGVYMYAEGVGSSRYNVGSTIAILMMVAVFAMMAVYIRQLIRMGDTE
ncbi:sugar ABC transporter permease [Jatrophihabitans cynanchi]|uniref:Sugar ABC transporter permease n=1 Tax=Jatrophihabitans cynanchi TaxID=2944128 RepID=A0ABY7K6F2_9ACTN|nr:sugar ABC transporter permease [Jatrophihabitans sp. SB3-54]WAX58846.1 sugar ABC transporter permease [Jatrophihabitans sp. SB3-54]